MFIFFYSISSIADASGLYLGMVIFDSIGQPSHLGIFSNGRVDTRDSTRVSVGATFVSWYTPSRFQVPSGCAGDDVNVSTKNER